MRIIAKIVLFLTLSNLLTACGFKSNNKDLGGIKQISDESRSGSGTTTDDSRPPKKSIIKNELSSQCNGFEQGEFDSTAREQILALFELAETNNDDFEDRASKLLNDLLDIHKLEKNEIKALNKYEVVGSIDDESALDFFDSEVMGAKMATYISCDNRLGLGKIGEYVFSTPTKTCVSKVISTSSKLYRAKMRCINRDDYTTKTITISE